MSGNTWFALGSALWLGVLTSISPCPLVANIAAISFIGRRVNHPGAVLFTGILYAVGRTLVYIALAALLVSSLLSAPAVSHALQRHMNKIMGPVLILVGMVLLGLIEIRTRGSDLSQRLGRGAERWGVWGALPLGAAFALAFCPSSAALYFGSLMPMSIQHESRLLLPSAFGIGTALPVIMFAAAIAAGAGAVAKAFKNVSTIERWARFATGVTFVLVGVYFSCRFILGVL